MGTQQVRSPGIRGSYLFGLTFAVGWSACVGPILGTMLTLAAQTSSVWRGMMLLFIYTLGLGLPLMIARIRSAAISASAPSMSGSMIRN